MNEATKVVYWYLIDSEWGADLLHLSTVHYDQHIGKRHGFELVVCYID